MNAVSMIFVIFQVVGVCVRMTFNPIKIFVLNYEQQQNRPSIYFVIWISDIIRACECYE